MKTIWNKQLSCFCPEGTCVIQYIVVSLVSSELSPRNGAPEYPDVACYVCDNQLALDCINSQTLQTCSGTQVSRKFHCCSVQAKLCTTGHSDTCVLINIFMHSGPQESLIWKLYSFELLSDLSN